MGVVRNCRVKNIKALQGLVAPKVAFACFSTFANRWCTARRFQGSGSCIFCRTQDAPDSLEHYCRCPIVWQFAAKVLNLSPPAEERSQRFFLVWDYTDSDDLIRHAIVVYAAYTAFHSLRHLPPGSPPPPLFSYLRRTAHHAVAGHTRSGSALRKSFVR